MQEHHWQACRVGPLNIWEYFRNLNAGSQNGYFEARLNLVLEIIF
jgi:hypothetical protein